MRRRAGGSLAFVALLACGCAHTIRVETPPPAAPAPARPAGPSVAIDSVAVRNADGPLDVSDELLLQVANRLRRSGLFATVYESAVSHEAPPEALRLTLDVRHTDHPEPMGRGMLKALLVVATVHLLAPALPYEYGYEADLDATFAGPQRWERSYRSHAEGSVRYPLTFSDPYRAGVETRTAVIDRALELLLHAVASDPEFASVPAVPDSP